MWRFVKYLICKYYYCYYFFHSRKRKFSLQRLYILANLWIFISPPTHLLLCAPQLWYWRNQNIWTFPGYLCWVKYWSCWLSSVSSGCLRPVRWEVRWQNKRNWSVWSEKENVYPTSHKRYSLLLRQGSSAISNACLLTNIQWKRSAGNKWILWN